MKTTFPFKYPVYVNNPYTIHRAIFFIFMVSVWDSGILCDKAVCV